MVHCIIVFVWTVFRITQKIDEGFVANLIKKINSDKAIENFCKDF